MLLNRLGNAVRKHDWFVVVIELVIVVAGIFIGLRVDDWNSARKDRAEEDRYVSLLADDIQTMLDEVRTLGERAARQGQTTRSAVLSLQNRESGPQARAAIGEAIVAYQVSPPFRFRRSTYDEMVSTGVLARLRDEELKRALTRTFAELQLARASIDRFRVSLPVVDAVVWRRVEMMVDSAGGVSVAVDPERLFDDLEFRNAVIEMLDIHYDVGTVYSNLEPLLLELAMAVAKARQ